MEVVGRGDRLVGKKVDHVADVRIAECAVAFGGDREAALGARRSALGALARLYGPPGQQGVGRWLSSVLIARLSCAVLKASGWTAAT